MSFKQILLLVVVLGLTVCSVIWCLGGLIEANQGANQGANQANQPRPDSRADVLGTSFRLNGKTWTVINFDIQEHDQPCVSRRVLAIDDVDGKTISVDVDTVRRLASKPVLEPGAVP